MVRISVVERRTRPLFSTLVLVLAAIAFEDEDDYELGRDPKITAGLLV